jgi:hypothetical protein
MCRRSSVIGQVQAVVLDEIIMAISRVLFFIGGKLSDFKHTLVSFKVSLVKKIWRVNQTHEEIIYLEHDIQVKNRQGSDGSGLGTES